MRSLGLNDEEIMKFADPSYWLRYFPPLTVKDMKSMGAHVGFFDDTFYERKLFKAFHFRLIGDEVLLPPTPIHTMIRSFVGNFYV